ncbi:MAG: alpha/beta hydrolase [Betaproteobacteria bacterium]|nr:alpha/beta hydrolase [Betaproteobacteria bacterium]NDA92703.1 alpha/beta hydrolase [Betaproteobacteria bacterium]
MNTFEPTIDSLPWSYGNLAVYRWNASLPMQARGVVLMVHGLGEHMGRYSQTAQVLQQEGWICVGYDHLGHGRSEGDRGKIPFSDALVEGLVHVAQHVIAEMPSKIAQDLPLILLGHSMGGLVVVQAIAKARDRMPDICAAVLSAPALGIFLSTSEKWLLHCIPLLVPNLCLANKIDTSTLCRDRAVVERYNKDPLVHRKISLRLAAWMFHASQQIDQCARDWSIPVLLLLAGKDELVDNNSARRFAQQLSAELVAVDNEPEMLHEVLNDPEKGRVLNRIADWMDLAVTSLPEAFSHALARR